ncbi:MAG: hypothetical protein Q9200_002161 [Gallowayella weberi]
MRTLLHKRSAWLERFNSASPTAQELSKFSHALNHHCLLRSLDPAGEPTVSTGTLIQITLYLSGPLLQGNDRQSGRFRAVQHGALVAAFALLHHNGLTTLTGVVHDQLRRNIADRFNDVVRASLTGLEDRIRKAEALYAVRLVAQYFALIKRDQPLTEALAIPIIGLVLAGASIASGQYAGLQSVFKYADHVIGLIPGREGHFLSLPGIQEVTRNATTLLHTVAVGDNKEDDPEEIQKANDAIQLVLRLLRNHFADIPSRRNDEWNWPLARLRRSPRSMNKWYFFYGLLSCVAQLAHCLRPGQLPEEDLVLLKQLMENTDFEEFRWKIIEIFQAYQPTSQWLGPAEDSSKVDESPAPRELAAVIKIARERVPAEWDDAIKPHPQSDRSMSTSSTNGHELPLSFQEPQPQGIPNTSEEDFEEFTEGGLECWQQYGDIHLSELLPSRSRFRRGEREEDRRLLKLKYDGTCQVADVSLSNTILAVSTRQKLEIHHLRPPRLVNQIAHGKYDPSGVAICETSSGVFIAVGQRHSTNGRVALHKFSVSARGLLQGGLLRYYALPKGSPKSLFFDGRTLVCITDVTNSVILWDVVEEPPDNGSPTTVRRGDYRPETDSGGVTSAAVYKSPMQRPYLICTTSASTERFRSGGEWPFISPIVGPNERVPPRTVHDLIAFKDHRQLVASAVSSVANKLAVLSKSGKILVVDLTGHEDGGVCSRTSVPDSIPEALCELKSSRATPACLKFDPSGSRLYAVDPGGKLIVVSFCQTTGRP